MKQNSIYTLPVLESSRFENLFNVYFDNTVGAYFYNILNTVTFNTTDLSPSIYEMYTVIEGDSYQFISFKEYGTINLWWLVCTFNNIQDPTSLPKPGEYLRILSREHIINILTSINRA